MTRCAFGDPPPPPPPPRLAAQLIAAAAQMILRSDERGDGAPYTEAEAKPVLKQLLGAVDCLHSNKVCHR